MADFCKQCAADMGPDWESDFDHIKNHLTEEEEAKGIGILVLCEGCGPIIVGREGQCICPPDNDCLEKHGAKRELAAMEQQKELEAWKDSTDGSRLA